MKMHVINLLEIEIFDFFKLDSLKSAPEALVNKTYKHFFTFQQMSKVGIFITFFFYR